MLASSLPRNPSLEQMRKKAKEYRDLVRTGHPKFTEPARRLHSHWAGAPDDPVAWAGFRLADAQLVLARMYGFPSWPKLRAHLDMLARYTRSPQRRPAGDGDPVDEFLRLACLTYRPSWRAGSGEEADDRRRPARARQLLAAHPHLASASIHTAAAVGDVAAARALLAADPALALDEGGPHRWPPLLYAALSRVDSVRTGHSTVEVARLLLAHGADPNAGYLPDGEPPPVTALSGAFHGMQDPVNAPAHPDGLALARLLLEAGADANDELALGNAGRYPHDDAHLPLLFAHGLGRVAKGPWRGRLGHRLPGPAELVQDELRYAAEADLADRVRLIVRHCAAIGIGLDAPEPWNGRTARDLAVLNGNTAVADLLEAVGAEVRPLDPAGELVAACLRADGETAARLLATDPGLIARAADVTWPPPMHRAAQLDRPESIRLMAAIGFPLDDPRGSALHIAALVGHLEVVRVLLELGADPTAEAVDQGTPGQFNPPDRTPLGWARYTGQPAVIALLEAATAGR